MESWPDLYILILFGFIAGFTLGAWVIYALFKLRILKPGKHPRHEWPYAARRATRAGERGNVFFVMFGAVALVGAVGAASMTVLKGPVRAMSEVTNRTVAENSMIATGRLAVLAASQSQANGGNCDGDPYVEPVPYHDAGGGQTAAGGGHLPPAIGAALSDPWQTPYSYCAWDHGSETLEESCEAPPGVSNRLAGIDGDTHAVLAVISAGSDRQFQTRCLSLAEADDAGNGNGVLDGDERLLVKPPGSDDIVMSYTYAEATTAGGGLWTTKSGETGTATIDKDLEVMDDTGTSVVFGLDRSQGVAEFLAIKTDNIYARTTPNGTVAVHDLLRVKGYDDLAAPAAGGGGGGSVSWAGITGKPAGFADGTDDGITTETDPKIGTLTSGRWCKTDGTQVICDQNAPAGGSGDGVPSGAVMAFNLQSCPPGWAEYVEAYGRFVRGIDRSGNTIDPEGERVAGHLQDDAFASHKHTSPHPTNAGGNDLFGEGPVLFGAEYEPGNDADGDERRNYTSPEGGAETRPKNVALLFCQKLDPNDDTPAAFDFTDQTGAAASSTVLSSIARIEGIAVAIAVAVSGDGSPELRICDDAACAAVDHDWATTGSVDNGQYLQLRLSTGPTPATAHTVTVSAGSADADWTVTTQAACGGAEVGGSCWYYGADGASCADTCSTRGGYDEATRTFAGSDGSDANCDAVLDAIGAPSATLGTFALAHGCSFFNGQRRRYSAPTTAEAATAGIRRACACNE